MMSHRFSIWGTLIFSSVVSYDIKFFMSNLTVIKVTLKTKQLGMVITKTKNVISPQLTTPDEIFITHINDLISLPYTHIC